MLFAVNFALDKQCLMMTYSNNTAYERFVNEVSDHTRKNFLPARIYSALI